jgi:peptidyl-prolyl isomerase E (cyclophilin E)
MDYQAGKHKGFGFVEYEDADDATEAIFNMDGADLLARTLRVSVAQPNQLNKLSTAHQAIWSSDEWFQQHVGNSEKEQEERKEKQHDESILTEPMR